MNYVPYAFTFHGFDHRIETIIVYIKTGRHFYSELAYAIEQVSDLFGMSVNYFSYTRHRPFKY